MDNADWEKVQANFNYFASQLTIDDDVMVAVADDEITIQELYDSGIRYKGSSMPINNEALTTISKMHSGLNVTIDIWRAAESRIITSIPIALVPFISGLFIFRTYTWFNGNKQFLPLPFLALALALILFVVIFWQLSRIKYKQVRKGITDIICQ